MTNYTTSTMDQDVNLTTTLFPATFMTTSNATGLNDTNCTSELSPLHYDISMIDKIFKPFLYALGFPGNTLAFIVWIRPRMTHSSGVYLATLALVDFIFLILHMLLYLNESWQIIVLHFPVVCESFAVIWLTCQYLAPLLVLAFTIERYISICHPFAREKYCTIRRARYVSVSLAIASLLICAIQAYFWTYNKGECGIRTEQLKHMSLWSVWSMVTEMLIFLIMPLCVLFFNSLVIRETKRLSQYEPGQIAGRQHKTSATTIMLLAVSFYLIVTTLPVSVVYVIVNFFKEGPPCASHETHPVWRQHYIYMLIREIIQDIGSTHFALNFYIYFITGKQFRKEFFKICRSVLGKSLPEMVRTEYSTLRGSFGDSVKKTMTVRLSSNGTTKEANDGETHV